MNCSIRRTLLAAGRCATRFVGQKDTAFGESLANTALAAAGQQ
jgi:hypothetical protein